MKMTDLPPGAVPKPVPYWGWRCDVCGRSFGAASWDDRHDGPDGDTFVHADCCLECPHG